VISGWNQAVSGTKASILFDNSKSGAVYTGCAVGGTAAAPYIFAANFNAGTVDVYDANLNLNPAPYNQSGLPQPYSGVIVVFESGDSGGVCSIQRAKYRWHAVCDLCGTGRPEKNECRRRRAMAMSPCLT
jgi:hypothetical protein